MWPEIKRKLFHLTGLIYVLGLIYIPRTTYLILLTLLLVLEFLIEMARLKYPPVRQWFIDRFGVLLRDKEHHSLSGTFWMMAGVLVTVSLTSDVAIGSAAILYLLLGDGVASLVGMRWGGPHWPGSEKRVSGSLACLFACLFVGMTLLRPQFGWHGILIGASVATLVEYGVVPLNDNFTIPVFSTIALMLCYS